MASKSKIALNHTAGIFSDMTVDGPQIGTLVVVVDRAKNLPNRKTIGKQDPYCACRLGKEAKKTTTDIRGGQTPKWDQELRFIVHDSPDYYQLKVSVFNDDKRTDLIGEAWIDLRDIIGPAGGDSDEWHQLNYKGKYAGEVRIEITFYDNRPKPERPVAKAKPMVTTDLDTPAPLPAVTTTSGPRSMPKRRPLPSDPVTGKAPPQLPQPAPEAVEAPSRPQPNPLPAPHQPTHSPQPLPEHHSPSPGAAATRYQEPLDPYAAHSPNGDYGASNRYVEAPPQQYRTSDRSDQYMGHPETFDRYGSRSQDSFDRPSFDPPPRDHRARSFDEDRPPPPPVHRSGTGSNPSMNASYQSGSSAAMRQDVLRNEALRQSSNTATYPGRPQYKASPVSGGSQYSSQEQSLPPRHFSYDSNFDPSYRAPMQATVEDVPESPDSIHGAYSRRRSFAPQPQPQMQLEPEYDMRTSPAPLNIARGAHVGNRYSPEAQEQRYSGSPAVAERYTSGPAVPEQNYGGGPAAPPQHYRHDSNGYAPSPPGQSPREVSGQRSYGRHSETSLVSYASPSDERALVRRSDLDGGHDDYVPPVPPSLVPGIGPKVAQQVAERAHQRRNTQPSVMETPPRGRTMSEVPPMYEQTRSPSYNAPSPSYNGPSPSYNAPSPSYNAPSPSYNAPSPSYNSQPPSHSRGQMIMYNEGPSTSQHQSYSQNPPRDRSPNPRTSPNPTTSPNPQHTIRRKSVSPAPPPAQADEPRRLSGIPFGPDSYDSFNPRASTSALRDTGSGSLDFNEATRKYIAPDGREVDPSDHLPEDTWAPEPEPRKGNIPTSISPRPSPGQDLSGSGRRKSMLPSSAVTYSGSPYADPASPSPPVTKGRTRLQKKQNRASVAVVPVAAGHGYSRSGGGSDMNGSGTSPLAPLAPHHDNFTPPRHLVRASTFDTAGSSENSPHYGGGYSPSPHSGGRPALPPIPAKVPMVPEMSGALQLHSSSVAGRGNLDDYGGYEQGGGRESERDMWGAGTLEDEMARIDIGTGRSRRRRW